MSLRKQVGQLPWLRRSTARAWSTGAGMLLATAALLDVAQPPNPTPATTPTSTTSPTSTTEPPLFAGLLTTPEQYALRDRDKARLTAALRSIDGVPDAFITTLPEASGASVLVLGGRSDPYALPDLADRFPQAFALLPVSSVLNTMPVIVGPTATLQVTSSVTPVVRLLSGVSSYATLVAVDATVIIEGSAETPAAVTSYDPATSLADQEILDGRSYVVTSGGRMQLDHVAASSLGFLLGETSGVAWMTRQGRPATGGARESAFTDNYFGAYASGADGLLISASTFTDNAVYGFDPHTGTRNTVIENSQAARNGRHGFIFSADCHNNVIRDSTSSLNGGSGFVIDDGNDDSEEPLRPSDSNKLEGVTANDNRATGIVIEGGTSNSVKRSRVNGNEVGVWVKNGATQTEIDGATIATSDQVGIRLDPSTAATVVSSSFVDNSTTGVWIDGAQATVLQDVSIDNSSKAAINLTGDPAGTTFTNVTVTGTGGAAVATADGQPTDLGGTGSSPWRSTDPLSATGRPDTAWLKALPWVLIVVIPAALWVPFRWQWRRHQDAQFRDSS